MGLGLKLKRTYSATLGLACASGQVSGSHLQHVDGTRNTDDRSLAIQRRGLVKVSDRANRELMLSQRIDLKTSGAAAGPWVRGDSSHSAMG